MDEINKTKEFLDKLHELAKARKERMKTLNLIEVWNILSDERKEEFAERIFDLAECYERSQINENLEKECLIKGHNYGSWEVNSYNNEKIWKRTCKRCGNIEHSSKNPELIIIKKRKFFTFKKPH